MFDWFERPMFYRRQPSLLSTMYALQRQRMLQDMLFSDFDFPQLYFVYRTPKKQDKKEEEEQENKEENKEAPKAENVETPAEEKHDEAPIKQEKKDDVVEEKHEEIPAEEKKSETPAVEEKKNEGAPAAEAVAEEKHEETPVAAVEEKKDQKVAENKKREIDDSNFTVETRTTTKKGGFKRVIRKEVNEETGVVITTEIRSINDQSMTLKRIYYGDGDIEEEESMSHLTKEDIPEFQAKWQKAFSN